MDNKDENMDNAQEDSVYAMGPGAVEPETIEPETIEPEVIEPEVVEPEVIEPEVTQSNDETGSNMYHYQSPYQPNMNYDEKPPKKKNNTKIIIAITAISLVVLCTFIGAVVTVNQLIRNSQGITDENLNLDNGSSGPLVSVQTVSGSSVSGVNDYSELVDNVMPSVVAITQDYTQTYTTLWGQAYNQKAQGSGSGFIVSQDDNELMIVTNNHVVEGAEKITVAFYDETTAEATVKGTDSFADLSVITVKLSSLKKTTKEKIKVAVLGDSDNLKVGQSAIAIGNALGYGQSVTVGYISAKDREVTFENTNGTYNKMRLLQTDAAINPGNSGGALLDINGKVIGINSGKYSSEDVEGMGYAIPISKAIPIINDLANRKVLKEDEKGYLGISGKTISKDVSEAYGIPVGVYVSEVAKGGAAEEAGVKAGDVIISIGGREVTTIEEVQELVSSNAAGTQIKMTVKRSDNGEYKSKEIKAKLKDSSTLDKLESSTNNSSSQNGQNTLPDNGSDNSSPSWGNDY